MANMEQEPYLIRIDSTLVGRPPGGSAASKAAGLRHEAPLRSVLGRLLRVRTDEQAWSKGAAGERVVARELARLPSGEWVAFHDIPIGKRGANFDHLVMGPGGVFSLNAKLLRGRVWVGERAVLVNGRRTDYLPKARREASRVSACLTRALGRPVPVRAVLVVICDELTVKQQPGGVDVVARPRLAAWLRARPATMTRAEVLAIAGKAHRPEMWA